MNPLIPPSSSLILPLSQLSPHCSRLLSSINDDRVSQKDRILYEQTLWSEVKKIRSLNDPSIFLHLIGYYHAILYQIIKFFDSNDLFQYNILVRLGDLSRYVDRLDVAEYYYCNARNLFPQFGHAYNQLALLTKPTNCFKCCYYYARAAKSTEKPLNSIADSNLRIAVNKYDCKILNLILENHVADLNLSHPDFKNVKLPKTSFDWLYVIVVAIYADNIAPIARQFLSYLNDNFATHKSTIILDGVKTTAIYCDRDSYILLASLDILLDWMKLGSQGKLICGSIASEVRQIRASLLTVVNSCKNGNELSYSNIHDRPMDQTNSTNTSDEALPSKVQQNGTNLADSTVHDFSHTDASQSLSPSQASPVRPLALPHDYVMRGFSPLEPVHKNLFFKVSSRGKGMMFNCVLEDNSSGQKFVDSQQLLLISLRLKNKIDSSGSPLRKRTRNIALESILCNLSQPHS